MIFIFLFVLYVWTIFFFYLSVGVRKTHSYHLPYPRSTEHLSLYMINPYSSAINLLQIKYYVSRLSVVSSVSSGRFFTLQLVILYFFKIFLTIVVLYFSLYASITYL
jgi:hypothetical protein